MPPPAPDAAADLGADRLLRALLLEVRRLGAEVEALREAQDEALRRMLAPDDRRLGAELVPLLARLLPEFTAAELAAEALDGAGTDWATVRALIADRIDAAGGLRSLGRLLARLEGVEFGGCRLVTAGAVRGAARWRVSRR